MHPANKVKHSMNNIKYNYYSNCCDTSMHDTYIVIYWILCGVIQSTCKQTDL